MNLKQYKDKLLADPAFAREYYKSDLAMEVSLMVQQARMLAGVTQGELAKRVQTKQPSIARLENGKYLPSLGFLQKIADALNTELIPPKMGSIEMFNEYLSINKAKKLETKIEDFEVTFESSETKFAHLLSQKSNSFGTKNL